MFSRRDVVTASKRSVVVRTEGASVAPPLLRTFFIILKEIQVSNHNLKLCPSVHGYSCTLKVSQLNSYIP